MIGFLQLPTGRMGNVLIQYAFLREIAYRCSIDYFFPQLPYIEYFEDFEKRNFSLWLKIKKKKIINMDIIDQMGMDNFLNSVIKWNKEGYNIVLQPPMLGHLFSFKDINPTRFIKIKEEIVRTPQFFDDKTNVGIHFRGTDFQSWNQKSILPGEFYINAVERVVEEREKEKLRFLLFTDDTTLSSYKLVTNFLTAKQIEFRPGNPENFLMDDFQAISQCDIVISSPSTFAIVAALMGKERKTIYHSKEWVEYCAEKNEQFWIDIQNDCVPYYNVRTL